jgi:hypothetical protein
MSETLNKGLANLKCKMNIFKQNLSLRYRSQMMIFGQFGSVKMGQSLNEVLARPILDLQPLGYSII